MIMEKIVGKISQNNDDDCGNGSATSTCKLKMNLKCSFTHISEGEFQILRGDCKHSALEVKDFWRAVRKVAHIFHCFFKKFA